MCTFHIDNSSKYIERTNDIPRVRAKIRKEWLYDCCCADSIAGE